MKQRYDQISLDEYTFKKVEVRLCLREGNPYYSTEPISSPDQAVNIMGQFMKDLDREMVAVVNLDTKHRPLNYNIVSIGSINASLTPIQNIMKSAMLCNAAAILLVHNHPSGSPAPSKEDMQLTEKVVEAGKLMELPLLDHVIIGSGDRERYSFREANPQMFEGPYRKEVLDQAKPKKHREMER